MSDERCEACGVMEAAIIKHKRDLSEAIRLLREVEWGDHNEAEEAICPVCQHIKGHRPHAPDCALAALLAKHPETR